MAQKKGHFNSAISVKVCLVINYSYDYQPEETEERRDAEDFTI